MLPSRPPHLEVHTALAAVDLSRTGTGDSAPALVDLPAVLRALWRHALLIIGLTVLAAGVTYALVRRQPAVYRASAVIRLNDARRSMAGGLASNPADLLDRSIDPILSQLEVLTSRNVVGRAIDSMPRLRLDVHGMPYDRLDRVRIETPDALDSIWLAANATTVQARLGDRTVTAPLDSVLRLDSLAFAVKGGGRPMTAVLVVSSREAAIERVVDNLRVKPREHTDIVDVTYSSRDSRLAQQVVNRVVRTFQLVDAEGAQQQSRLRREFVEQQLRQNDSLLSRAQLALSSFRSGEQIFSSRDKLAAEQSALATINLERQRLEADQRVFRSALTTLEHNAANDEALVALMASPSVSGNSVLSGLYATLTRLQHTRDSLTAGPSGDAETNPRIRSLDQLISKTQGQMTEAVRGMIASVDERIKGIDTLKAENAAAFRDVSGKEAGEARLTQQVEALRTISNQLREEYQRARIAEAVEVGRVEIVDLAPVARREIGVGPVRKLMFGGMLGLMLGCGIAWLLEQFNTSIRRRDQIRSALQVPELAVIPQLREQRLRRRLRRRRTPLIAAGASVTPLDAKLVAASDLYSSGAEAYRLLRTNLLFANPARTPKTVLVTSPAPGDGKTTIAANLAVTFAQQGMNVVLIDCDLRRGRLHQVFNVPREPGVSQVLRGQIAPQQGIASTAIERLSVMPMGTVPKNPAELLGAPAMRELLDGLSRQYDVLVLDAPPVLAAVDASLAAVLVDATVVVLRAGETGEDEARQALSQLHTVGARIAGAVLNDQNATVERYGGYYYSGYYGARESE
jgi:tyrosine-protein kinase Etk/Wzc